jgi:hypothetical protein
MRKWGVIVTLGYALLMLVLMVPGWVLLVGDFSGRASFYAYVKDDYAGWIPWTMVGVLAASQALLLFLKVDTSRKRLKPRSHILVSSALTAFFLALLTLAGGFSAWVAFKGDKGLDFVDRLPGGAVWILAAWVFLWLLWGIVFYRFSCDSSDPVTRAVSWLIRGSVLELLIAVPAHVIVRRRHDCSAPGATAFGITSGIAIMLLAFGPSVLLLYKKRMEGYSARAATGKL